MNGFVPLLEFGAFTRLLTFGYTRRDLGDVGENFFPGRKCRPKLDWITRNLSRAGETARQRV